MSSSHAVAVPGAKSIDRGRRSGRLPMTASTSAGTLGLDAPRRVGLPACAQCDPLRLLGSLPASEGENASHRCRGHQEQSNDHGARIAVAGWCRIAGRSGLGRGKIASEAGGLPMPAELPSDQIELRHAATDRATIVVVPERRMFAIDGLGDPRTTGFVLASDTLRAADEALRARVQREHGHKIARGVLECAWWTHPEPPSEDLATSFADRSTWHWQQMLEIPSEAGDEDAQAAIEESVRTPARRPRRCGSSSLRKVVRRRFCMWADRRPNTGRSWPCTTR